MKRMDPALSVPPVPQSAPQHARGRTGLQRARGRAEVVIRQEGGRNRLERLFQQGSAKAILPRTHSATPEAVIVNTSGGLTGGDRLDLRFAAGGGAALTVTTQAAERIYRAASGAAEVTTELALGRGARLDWLPQETILFDGGALARRLEIDMAADAKLTALETIVLGRTAMGETVHAGSLRDHWRLRRDGRLVHAEALCLEGDLGRAMSGQATLNGARAFATLVHAAPGAEDRLAAARHHLPREAPVLAAASAKPGILIVRFACEDARLLRAGLIRFLMGIRREALPRVWSL